MIKFENVSFIYSKNTPFKHEALHDVSLEIKDKSFTCLVGKTGCGKSTLIQHLNGLLIPEEGKVIIDEFVVSKKRKERTRKLQPLRKHVGVVFQFSEYQLFEESVEKDVAFGPMNFGIKKDEAYKIAHEALKTVGIKEEYFKKSPFDLSGGEKRRVSIAGILALKPDILVLDEPTAGLDPIGAKEMLSLFKSLNEQGVTIILVTHDMNLVLNHSDNVVVINDGHIAFSGTPSDLFAQDVSKYSIEVPELYKFCLLLKSKGVNLDITKVRTIDDLMSQLRRMKNE